MCGSIVNSTSVIISMNGFSNYTIQPTATPLSPWYNGNYLNINYAGSQEKSNFAVAELLVWNRSQVRRFSARSSTSRANTVLRPFQPHHRQAPHRRQHLRARRRGRRRRLRRRRLRRLLRRRLKMPLCLALFAVWL